MAHPMLASGCGCNRTGIRRLADNEESNGFRVAHGAITPVRKGSGSHLASHVVSNVVLSAASGLTVVFGMGTGVTPRRIATGNIQCP